MSAQDTEDTQLSATDETHRVAAELADSMTMESQEHHESAGVSTIEANCESASADAPTEDMGSGSPDMSAAPEEAASADSATEAEAPAELAAADAAMPAEEASATDEAESAGEAEASAGEDEAPAAIDAAGQPTAGDGLASPPAVAEPVVWVAMFVSAVAETPSNGGETPPS